MGNQARWRRSQSRQKLGIIGLWVLVVAISSLVGSRSGDAKTLIAPPLTRRCTTAATIQPSPQQYHPQQQQQQHQLHQQHQQAGFLTPLSSSLFLSARRRRALAWPRDKSISSTTLSALLPQHQHQQNQHQQQCQHQARRLNLFQRDVRLWLPPHHLQHHHHHHHHYVATGVAAMSTLGRATALGGSRAGDVPERRARQQHISSSTNPSYSYASQRTLRGGGLTPTMLSATRVESPSVATASAAPGGVEITKPERDERSYRHLVLPNGLEVVIASDATTETAAASMLIRCGHQQDPGELAGMAHFHEHMLFLGTEKYPDEGEFESFLTQHGGSSNAYTATESTNYFFDVEASQLRGATDRFAQFFQTPLFSASALERELQAVDSEHSNNKNEDSWRLYQVLKATANPAHAFSKFGSGNYETLKPRPEEGVDTRESLIKFHETYYSADAMKLCILGKEDLDTLEAWVREMFSGVRNTAPPAVPDYGPAPAFGEGELGRRVTAIPLRESRRLALSWPLPPQSVHKRSKPTIYVSHLLGYEGEGGLHAFLHGRGWVTSLSAGSIVSGIDFQLFRLSMTLTEEGEKHSDEIVELCHRFIALLKAEPPQKSIQDDLAAMGAIRFRFLEKTNPSSAVQNMATSLGEDETDPKEVLSDPFTIPEWDAGAITDTLDRLSPRNCQILVVSKKDEAEAERDSEKAGWKKEPWYGTTYKVEQLPEDVLQKLETLPAHEEGSPAFFLPGVNPFVPTEFGLRADDEDNNNSHEQEGEGSGAEAVRGALGGAAVEATGQSVSDVRNLLPPNVPALALETVPRDDWSRLIPPSVVAGEGGVVKVWHKLDRSYRVPRSVIVAKVWTPEPYASPETAVLSRMFVRMLKEDLKCWAYDAALADLRYSFEMTTHGLQLTIAGFSSKVALLLSKTLGHIGELLVEYRSLGALLESAATAGEEQPLVATGEGEGGGGGGEQSASAAAVAAVSGLLTARQELLLQRFETSRQSFLRGYRNTAKEQPYETAGYYVRQVMEAEVWNINEYQEVLEDDAACTPGEMARHFDRLLTRLQVEVLAHGNMARGEAVALAPAIDAALSHPAPLPEEELPTRHALKLAPTGGGGAGEGCVVVELEAKTEEEKNSAVQVYLQVGPGNADLDLASEMDFINTLGYTSAFQQLRTQEQLGYIVYTQLERGAPGKVTPYEGGSGGGGIHPGGPLAWSVVVQSPDKSPAELEERVEAWIAGFRDELANISDEVFEATVASMSSSILRRERSMSEEAGIFFNAISGRTHDFHRRYRKGESYRRLTRERVLAAYDEHLAPSAPGRRKLTVRISSRARAREAEAAAAAMAAAQGGGERRGEERGDAGEGGGGGGCAAKLGGHTCVQG